MSIKCTIEMKALVILKFVVTAEYVYLKHFIFLRRMVTISEQPLLMVRMTISGNSNKVIHTQLPNQSND